MYFHNIGSKYQNCNSHIKKDKVNYFIIFIQRLKDLMVNYFIKLSIEKHDNSYRKLFNGLSGI
jgi:hypothetical protein